MAQATVPARDELATSLDIVFEVILWLSLAFTPLLVNVANEDAYRTVQAMFLAVTAAVAVVLWISAQSLRRGWPAVVKTPILWALLAFDVWSGATCFLSSSRPTAFESFFNLILMTLLYLAVAHFVREGSRGRPWRLLIPTLFALLANCILGVMQYYHFDFMALGHALSSNYGVLNYFAGLDAPARQNYAGHGSAAGVLGNQNVLGDYMIGAMPLLVAVGYRAYQQVRAIWNKQQPMGVWEPGARLAWLGWVALTAGIGCFGLLSLLCLYMSITAGAWIAFAITCTLWVPLMVLYFWAEIRRIDRRFFLGLGFIALLVVGGVGGVAIHKRMTPRSVLTFVHNKEHDFDQRVNAWKVAGLMLKDRPLTGQGLATYKILYFRFLAQEFHGNIPEIMHNRYVQAHDDWIQLAAETGLPGILLALGALGAFFYGSLRYLWRRELAVDDALLYLGALAGMLAIMLSALVGFPFHIAASSGLFVVLAGLVSGLRLRNLVPVPQAAPAPSEFKLFLGKVAVPVVSVVGMAIALHNLVMMPYWADEHAKQGMNLYQAQQIPAAQQQFLKTVEMDPERGDAHMLLGMTFAMMQQFPMAAYHLHEAERSYDDVTLHYYLGVVDEGLGRLPEAKHEFKIAESYFPAGTPVRDMVVKQLAALDKKMKVVQDGPVTPVN